MRLLGLRAGSGGLVLTGKKGNRHGQPESSGRILRPLEWLSGRHEPRLLKNLVQRAALKAVCQEPSDRVTQVVQGLFLAWPLASNVE